MGGLTIGQLALQSRVRAPGLVRLLVQAGTDLTTQMNIKLVNAAHHTGCCGTVEAVLGTATVRLVPQHEYACAMPAWLRSHPMHCLKRLIVCKLQVDATTA